MRSTILIMVSIIFTSFILNYVQDAEAQQYKRTVCDGTHYFRDKCGKPNKCMEKVYPFYIEKYGAKPFHCDCFDRITNGFPDAQCQCKYHCRKCINSAKARCPTMEPLPP